MSTSAESDKPTKPADELGSDSMMFKELSGTGLHQVLVLLAVGSEVSRTIAETPGIHLETVGITQADIIRSPLSFLPLLAKHPDFIDEANKLLESKSPFPLVDRHRARLLPKALRAVTSSWLATVTRKGLSNTTQTFINQDGHNVKPPDITPQAKSLAIGLLSQYKTESQNSQPEKKELIDILTGFALNAVRAIENSPLAESMALSRDQTNQLMLRVLPGYFWILSQIQEIKDFSITARHFSRLIEAVCELDRHQILHQISRSISTRPTVKSIEHWTAEENLLNAYRRYLHFQLSSNLSLAHIHSNFINIPGLENIVSPDTLAYLQGAWREVAGTQLFTAKLAESLPDKNEETQLDWIFAPEELDMQGIDSILIVTTNQQPTHCLLAQIKSSKGLPPHRQSTIYCFSDEPDFPFPQIFSGGLDDIRNLAYTGKIRRDLPKIRSDFQNVLDPHTKEHQALMQLISDQSGQDVINPRLIPVLILVPAVPAHYPSP